MALPLVLHIPHASSVIPADLRETLLLDDDALSRELLAMTDWHTDRLFAFPGTEAVVHPVSRLICDPERFVDDAREPMAAFGMGVVYTRTHRFGILRQPPTQQEREALLNRFYRPHHARLEEAVSAVLDRFGWCLLLDCHSFPSRPLPYERCAVRSDICIGTDEFHTPSYLSEKLVELFREQGFVTMINQPFSGAIVPLSRYQVDRRVVSVMIEVNRCLYMDEESGAQLAALSGIASVIRDILTRIIEEMVCRYYAGGM
jgi:N-formylglutamate amidohydrolase